MVQHTQQVFTLTHSLKSGCAWGMAFSEALGSLVCQVVEVSGSDTSIRVRRVTCVVDSGTAINPGSAEMQMQGGISHGLNAALTGAQSFVSGAQQVANFNRIKMLRVKDAPQVDVYIIQSGERLLQADRRAGSQFTVFPERREW